jgi:hypothetical protein
MHSRTKPTTNLTPLLGSIALLPGLLLLSAHTSVAAQQQFLEVTQPTGQPIAPVFDGWYANPDGTYTFQFGFFNFNREGTVHVPLGEANFITPREFDSGMQPTFFAVEPDRRQEGAFTVTVPTEFGDGRDLVWSLTAGGQTYTVPAHVGVTAYQLDYAARAGGSTAPLIGFDESQPPGQFPEGIVARESLTGRVGEPVTITVWTRDPSERPDDDTRPDAGATIPVGLTPFTHQGPAPATFDPSEGEVGPDEGNSWWSTNATFSEPGEYMVRIRADNWTARDSSGGNQCCWSNAYVRVVVTP